MADNATGITMVFATSGFTCEIIDVTPPKFTRGKVDTTHQGTVTARTSIPTDLIDWDDATITFAFDPGTDPPANAGETITITWPAADTWQFTGYFTEYGGEAPLDDKMVGTAVLGISGDVTIA